MKLKRTNWIWFPFIAIVLLILNFCNKRSNEVDPVTELHITLVKDSVHGVLNNVQVALFDNLTDYTTSSINFSTAHAVDTVTAIDGKCSFKGLKANQNYWIAAYYKDYKTYTSSIVPNLFIQYDNSQGGYALNGTLNGGSITYITLKLKPAESLITFYADNSNPKAFPISVQFGNDTLQPLTQPGSPRIYQSNVRTLKVRYGTHSYYTKNRSDCSTIEAINLVGGESIFINTTCNSGIISFWSDSSNVSVFPINISLNVNSDIGNLSVTSGVGPVDCYSSTVVKYSLPAGEYTYFAKTNNKDSCAWTGKFTITAMQCNSIQLLKCQ